MIIEMVTPALVVGGMEVFIERLSLMLRARGHDVGVTCLYGRGPIFDRMVEAGFDVELVPVPGTVRTIWPRQLVSRFRRRKVEVVHAHSGSWLKAAVAARLAGASRTVLTHHGLMGNEGWYEHWHARQAARLASATVAVSEPLRRYLHETAGIPEAALCQVANGVTLASYERHTGATQEARRLLGIPTDAIVIAIVARLTPVKRHDVLIEAFGRLAQLYPNVHLLVAGDGPERTNLEALNRKLVEPGRVQFLGAVSDPRPVLWAADIFTMCSDSEGQPMALLEAMAAGCAVVATAVGGMPETLGATGGFTVTSGDSHALEEALRSLVTDEAVRQRLAHNARTRSIDFSLEASVDRYEALYRAT